VTPSVGWGVLHLLYTVDRARGEREPGSSKRVLDAIAELESVGHDVLVFAGLGHKFDLGIMALGPDLARLQRFQTELRAAPLTPAYSYVSLTELSEYTTTEDDERSRLAWEEGVSGSELESRLQTWRERMTHYQEQRIHPKLPRKAVLGFYPMSKRRDGADNWYTLGFDDRKRLMLGHGRVGRQYAGRIVQLITGSTGLDDHEWGVTLLADDVVALKDIVSEMRFDEVSARYAEFGPFFVGLVLDPADALARVGLVD
jgi:hydrogen peroxide-dependent heme synthase